MRAKSARFVDVLIHFIVRDEPQLSGWQSGLFSAAGVIKPSLYRLQRLAGRRWVSIGHPTRTNVFGSYTRVIRAATGTRLRILYYPAGAASRARVSSRPIVVR